MNAILDANGKPARKAVSRNCPRCAAGPESRIASGGFGIPHPVCAGCGYEWVQEVFVKDDDA